MDLVRRVSRLEERVAALEAELATGEPPADPRAEAPAPRGGPEAPPTQGGPVAASTGGGPEALSTHDEPRAASTHAGPVPTSSPLWALDTLRSQVREPGAVLFTGSVSLPGPRRYEWQQGFEVDQLLGADWADGVESLAALAHPVRLALVQAVLKGTDTAAALAETEGLGTTGQLYHHLRQLIAAGWLRSPARGRYEVPAGRVVALLVIVAAAAHS